MEINKFIKRYDDILSLDLCDKIVISAKKEKFKAATLSNSQVNKTIRNCYTNKISEKFDNLVFKIVSKAISQYCNDFKWCINGIGSSIEDTGYIHLIYKGSESGEYKMHVDHVDTHPRVLSCSLILNDNYDGGDFVFFDEKYLVKKKKGSIVMFPSNFCFPHAITPVSNGDRHAIITWIH